MAYIYMVSCEDGSIYTGIAMDIKKRLVEHLSKSGAKYTKSHKVKKLETLWSTDEYRNAAKLEYRIKHLSRIKKLWLIQNPHSVGGLFCELDNVSFSVENTELFKDLFDKTS